jgi:DNA replication factor GINS
MTGKTVPQDSLTEEEETLQRSISPSVEAYQDLLKKILTGRLPHLERKKKPKKIVVRILKEIPAIIGSDMKAYGPFKAEDIATLPPENARVLIKQGVAAEIEVKL